MGLWEVGEYIGEFLVFSGVAGEVLAGWKNPANHRLEKISSIVCVVGLAISFVSLIGTNGGYNSTIADLNNRTAKSNENAGEAARDAAQARKETAQVQKDTQGLKTEAEIAKRDMVAAQLELARLTGPINILQVNSDGAATPDLSKGLVQQLLLTADVHIEPPILPPLGKEGTATWTLFLDQDSVGSHQYTFEFMRDVKAYPGLVPNSRASFDFITDTHGRTTMRGIPLVDMPNTKMPSKKK
jgi:hypothetical protein